MAHFISTLFGGGKDIKMPTVTAEQAKKTAEPVETLTEDQKRNRKIAASFYGQDFDNLTLGKQALLGL